MRAVWKFPLHLDTLDDDSIIEVKMPAVYETLTVQTQQRGSPCLWALVDTESEPEVRRFRIVGTGHEIPFDAAYGNEYIGTFQLMDGALVLHVFEVLP